MQSPLIPEIGIVALVPDHWSEWWQPRHYVLTQLSRYFRVVWVNPAKDLRHVLKGRWHSDDSSADKYPGFTVYKPELWLPKLHRPKALADYTFRQRLKHARELLEKNGVSKQVLYVWRPVFAQALDLVNFDATCYHLDDEYSFSSVELPIHKTEAWLLSNVNQVFIHSPGLMERKGRFNPNTEMISNGVDFKAYSNRVVEPSDLASVPRPRIGYTGWLKKHLDWPLLLHLTERHPSWSFVFVGPISPHPELNGPLEILKSRPNVYLLGAKSSEELPTYPQHFDVCIMPYARNDYTKYIYPLKLHEYLAAGRPTVGTRIRSLQEFSQSVGLAVTPDEWSAQIAEALRPEANTPELFRQRQEIARQYDWEILVKRIARTIAMRLGKSFVNQFDAATNGYESGSPTLSELI